jgi:hypothetical protein
MKVPTLEHDVMMETQFGVKVSHRGRVERAVVYALGKHLEAAGFLPVAVDDGETRTKVDSIKAAMELVFNLDEAHVFFRKPHGRRHWVYLVLGNGEDVVSDYGLSESDGWSAAMDAFDPYTAVSVEVTDPS